MNRRLQSNLTPLRFIAGKTINIETFNNPFGYFQITCRFIDQHGLFDQQVIVDIEILNHYFAGLVGTAKNEIYIGAYDALRLLTHALADGSLRTSDWWNSESAYETIDQCAHLEQYKVQDYEYKIGNCTDEYVYVCERPSS